MIHHFRRVKTVNFPAFVIGWFLLLKYLRGLSSDLKIAHSQWYIAIIFFRLLHLVDVKQWFIGHTKGNFEVAKHFI